MPRVSAIIPNYNHAAFLQQRIDSVLNQTFNDFELIILDDCSTDSSKEIIEQYRHHKKVSNIIYNSENSGNPFEQWDKGIRVAQGEYVWIAESDDWCEVNLLETVIAGLEKNKNCVLGYCQSYCVSEGGEIRFQSNHTKIEEYVDGDRFIKEFILLKNPIFNAGMAVWKKEFYKKISHDYIKYRSTGDYLFWIELSVCGKIFISGKLLNYFRVHNRNVSIHSARKGLSFTEQIPIFNELFKRGVITAKDYKSGLQRIYLQFRLQQNTLSSESVFIINALFNSCFKAKNALRIYAFQKLVQRRLKKLIRI